MVTDFTMQIWKTTPIWDIKRLVERRKWFSNASKTFRGTSLTPKQSVALQAHSGTRADMPNEAWLAMVLDNPDYVIWVYNLPVAWHSTTRGIKHRKDVSNHEWVFAVKDDSEWRDFNAYARKHVEKVREIIERINDRP